MWGAADLFNRFADYMWGDQPEAYQAKIEEINNLLKECLHRETASIQFSMDANKDIICAVYLGIPGFILDDFFHQKRRLLFSGIMYRWECKQSKLITSNNTRESGNIIFTFSNLRECLLSIESDLRFYLSVNGNESDILNRFDQGSTNAFIEAQWLESVSDMMKNNLWPIPQGLQYKLKIESNELKLFFDNSLVPRFLLKK